MIKLLGILCRCAAFHIEERMVMSCINPIPKGGIATIYSVPYVCPYNNLTASSDIFKTTKRMRARILEICENKPVRSSRSWWS